MKLGIIVFSLLISYNCYAENYGRVCVERDSGKLVEFQSGDAPLGTLRKNAITGGYNAMDIEESYVTRNQWLLIKDKWINKPNKEIADIKENERKVKEDKIKTKLNLSEQDFQDLKDALK